MKRRAFSELTQGALERDYEWPSGVRSRVNLVFDSDGSIQGDDGTSLSLTSINDRRILRAVRNTADVVVVGANSVRAEGWHIPAVGKLIVISNGSFDGLPPCPQPQRVIVTDFVSATSLLPTVSRWVCEGGKVVVEQLLAGDLVDELCISFRRDSNMVETQHVELPRWIVESAPSSFVLSSWITDASLVFTRWRRG